MDDPGRIGDPRGGTDVDPLLEGFPATVRLLSLSDDALVEETGPGCVTVVSAWAEHRIDDLAPAAVELLRRMGFGPVLLTNALTPADRDAGGAASAEWEAVERALAGIGGAIVHSVAVPGGRPLLSAVPVVPEPAFRPVRLTPGVRVRLSPHAVMRPRDDAVLLDAAGAAYRVLLLEPESSAVVGALVRPATAAEVAVRTGLDPAVAGDLLAFLVTSGVAAPADQDAGPDAAERFWTPDELAFHHRRPDRRSEPPPGPPPEGVVTRTPPRGRRFPLPATGAQPVGPEPSLRDLLETDLTCPDLSGRPVTVEQLGELLHRSARIRSTGLLHAPGSDDEFPATQRPYFSTACLYELEIFVCVQACRGLPGGTAFHYDPGSHALVQVDDDPARVGGLLDAGRIAAAGRARPAVLLLFAARMPRASWLLRGSTYATALVHAGSLGQVLRLNGQVTGLDVHAVPFDVDGATEDTLRLHRPQEVAIGACVVETALVCRE